jgi:hypothetical protein
MSRGPGKIQRAIEAAFRAEPDNAFLLSEMCERVYPGVNRIEKKHRVAVARAVRAIPQLGCWHRETLGRELVIFDPCDVMSRGMATLKADRLSGYEQNNDPRKAEVRKRCAWLVSLNPQKYGHYANAEREISEQELRNSLASGGENHRLVMPGGAWWRHTEMERAKRRGDVETYDRLRFEQAKAEVALLRGAGVVK